mgnify:CR=1 FL=1
MQGSVTSANPPRPATGKLGILTPGLGAVATTFIAGVESVRRGLSKPIGSLTQMATIRLGKRTENRSPLIKDFVPLAGLEDLVFGAWDPIADDALSNIPRSLTAASLALGASSTARFSAASASCSSTASGSGRRGRSRSGCGLSRRHTPSS